MTEKTKITVVHEVGLHARPASMFVKTASAYQSDIQITNLTGDKGPVDAKSILSILTLGVEQDCEIELEANGPDEKKAIDALTDLVQRNFDEA